MFTAKYYYHISNSSTKLGHELDSFQKLAQLCNETIVLAGSGRGGGGQRTRSLLHLETVAGSWVE